MKTRTLISRTVGIFLIVALGLPSSPWPTPRDGGSLRGRLGLSELKRRRDCLGCKLRSPPSLGWASVLHTEEAAEAGLEQKILKALGDPANALDQLTQPVNSATPTAGLEGESPVETHLMELVDQLQAASGANDWPHVAELLREIPQVEDQEKTPPVQELLLAIQGYRVESLLYPYYAGAPVTEEVLRNFKEALALIPPLLEPDAPFQPETQTHFRLNLMETIRVLTAVDRLTESEADAYLLNPRLHLSSGSVWLRRGDFALKELLGVCQLAQKLGLQANLIFVQENPAVRRAFTKVLAIFSLAATEDPKHWIDWNSERRSLLRFA